MAGLIPTGGDAHFDVPLSNLAISAFNEGVADFIADQLFPAVPVGNQSNKYYTIEKDHFLMVPGAGALRAPKTQARRVEFTISSDQYFCQNYALANELSLEDLANADMAIDLRTNSVRLVTAMLRRAQEERIANLVTSATNVGSGVLLTGTAKWSDFTASDPISDVNTARAFIRSRTGLEANTLVLDFDTMQVLQTHPVLLDHFKYTAGGLVTEAQMASVFRIPRILVGKAIRNVAPEGQVISNQNIWGNNCLVCYTQPAAGMQAATLGLRFEWTPAGFPAPFGVERRVDTGAGTRKVEIIEAGHFQDAKLVARDLGYLIANTL